jgi:hypothetical protein
LRQAGSKKKPITFAASMAERSCGFLYILWSSDTNAHPPSCPIEPSQSVSGTEVALELVELSLHLMTIRLGYGCERARNVGRYVVINQQSHAAI